MAGLLVACSTKGGVDSVKNFVLAFLEGVGYRSKINQNSVNTGHDKSMKRRSQH